MLPYHHGLEFVLKKRNGKWDIVLQRVWIGEGAVDEPPVGE